MKNILRTITLVSSFSVALTVNAVDVTHPNGIEHSPSSTTFNQTTQTVANLININTASEKELSTLKGIGSKKAQAIIAYRETHGDFVSIEDLKNVKGIGNKIVLKLKGFIEI